MMGARIKRKEDPRLITGAGQYTGDLTLPGMLHAVFVRSPYAHARIGAIDSSAAAAMPGVVAIYTGNDLRDAYSLLPVDTAGEGDEEVSEPTDPLCTNYPLATGEVRHAGEA